MPLSGLIIDREGDLEPWLAQWDQLAIAARQPYSAPAWGTAWWRHARPETAALRVVLAVDGDGTLGGIAPFWVDFDARGPARYRMLGAGLASPVEALMARGQEVEATQVIVSALETVEPRPGIIRLEKVRLESAWPRLLAETWAGSAWTHSAYFMPAPGVNLEGLNYDDWLKTKSRSFRQRARRVRRHLEEAGGRFKVTEVSGLERDLRDFSRLHHARWDWRGGSSALGPGVEQMLGAVGRDLVPQERFRLLSIEIDGRAISSHLFICAGGHVAYWNGGFDAASAEYAPGIQGLLQAIRDATEREESYFDLGPGGQEYKYRLADRDELRATLTLVPRRARTYPHARMALLGYQARSTASQRLSPETKRRIQSLRRVRR